MNNVILFCKKFKIPYENRTIHPNRSYSARVRVYDYKNILVNNLELVDKLTKTKHFVILKLEHSNMYAFSDVFDRLYKSFTKKEKEEVKVSIQKDDDILIVNVKLLHKEYSIKDWGKFYPNNQIKE